MMALVIGFLYATSRRLISGFGWRFLVATLIGAAVNFLLFFLILDPFANGQTGQGIMDQGLWPFAPHAAGAGAISAFLYALIAEI
jgi:hypothetical protein